MPVVTAIAIRKNTIFYPKNHAFDPLTHFLSDLPTLRIKETELMSTSII
jgi:hypothetical protein